MDMPGRNVGQDYNFSFNGKLDDKSNGWQTQNFGARNYDSRLGRFFTEDPLGALAPHKSTYSFGGNSPIYKIDYEGLFDIQYSPTARVSPEARAIFRNS